MHSASGRCVFLCKDVLLRLLCYHRRIFQAESQPCPAPRACGCRFGGGCCNSYCFFLYCGRLPTAWPSCPASITRRATRHTKVSVSPQPAGRTLMPDILQTAAQGVPAGTHAVGGLAAMAARPRYLRARQAAHPARGYGNLFFRRPQRQPENKFPKTNPARNSPCRPNFSPP